MNTALKRNTKRAPRYTLRPHDSKVLRFSKGRRGAQTVTTEIVNISETGLAFEVDINSAPSIGELIKIEFRVPAERQQVAWYARVIWLESPFTASFKRKSVVRVGIQFYELPEGHRKILDQGLSARFREIKSDRRRRQMLTALSQFFQVLIYLSIIGAVGYFFYYFNQNTPTYNSKKPSAWGERFFKKVIKPTPPGEN